LYGQEFELIIRRNNWGENRVYFNGDDNQLMSLPTNYTNVYEPDPFVILSAGRSHFKVADLMELVRLIQERKGQE